ncbi:hypothetical protein [Vibrio sp. MEBiC08052]|uniref:hypothetical protein n=1 Tax=Vibrio sp. MEBiC08052 TaxID=1761910 RepID=UPI0007405B5E|nr:hypothetical protein [Vibrio sp. MEBiC08052]KUJ00435.1 hypothetical protein VRK_05660 [Vibrio sp. MEBiC08052]
MKRKGFVVHILWSIGLAFSVMAAPENRSQTDTVSAAVSSGEQARVEQRVEQLFAANSPLDVVRIMAEEKPIDAPLVLQAVYRKAPNVSLEDLVLAAFNAAPESALAIASTALDLGLDAILLPGLAIAANIDPTTVAQATAAGPAATQQAPIIRRHPRGSGISPS